MASLDNGVMRRPSKPDTGARSSRSMDFKSIIAKGENPNGQTTIAPTEVCRGGQSVGYPSYKWNKGTDGDRWGSNPNLYKEP